MTERDIDTLIMAIHEMAIRVGAEFVPDDAKIIIFRRAQERTPAEQPKDSDK